MRAIAQQFGTPVYVYSANIIRQRIADMQELFSTLDATIAFAIKVNNNLSILKLMADAGIGADIISRGELYRYLEAGGDHKKVMFAGVAKSEEEIAYAIDQKIALFNAESIDELLRINSIAAKKNTTVNVALRLNPDVEADTNAKISTGKRGVKFGISLDTILANIDKIKALKNICVLGVDMHIGSQILDSKPYVDAYTAMASTVKVLRDAGFDITTVDIGGGYGVPYRKDIGGFDIADYKKNALPILKSMNVKIIVEPGRYLVAESGALLMNVEYIKEEWGKSFVIVNGGMNDYIRVPMYDAYNDILPVVKREGSMIVDVVGPICETSDSFAIDRVLSPVIQGDKLALIDAGAYGFSMASNYNARPFIAEVLVDGDTPRLIRKRQPVEDMIIYEKDLL
jgi:diaminopimelate decarboxylase